VLTRLIQGEQDGERLTETELLHNGIFLLNAGHETTTNLIGNALVCLHEWPQHKAWLQQRLRGGRARFRGFLRAPFRV
jgi:cytochrome P450